MTIREESIDQYTDIRYDGDKPIGIVTNRRNLDAAIESVEQHLGAPLITGTWRREEGYCEVSIELLPEVQS